MDAGDIEKGAALLARFEGGGFSQLFGDELRELGRYLEAEATETARATSLLLSQAVFAVDGFFRDHDEYGGVQADFVSQLDNLASNYFAKTATTDATESARLARDFRDIVRHRLDRYAPDGDYDPSK